MIYNTINVQCDFCKAQSSGWAISVWSTREQVMDQLIKDGWKFTVMFGAVKKVYCPVCAKKSEELERGKK